MRRMTRRWCAEKFAGRNLIKGGENQVGKPKWRKRYEQPSKEVGQTIPDSAFRKFRGLAATEIPSSSDVFGYAYLYRLEGSPLWRAMICQTDWSTACWMLLARGDRVDGFITVGVKLVHNSKEAMMGMISDELPEIMEALDFRVDWETPHPRWGKPGPGRAPNYHLPSDMPEPPKIPRPPESEIAEYRAGLMAQVRPGDSWNPGTTGGFLAKP
jgi:hypothetical protein